MIFLGQSFFSPLRSEGDCPPSLAPSTEQPLEPRHRAAKNECARTDNVCNGMVSLPRGCVYILRHTVLIILSSGGV